MSCLYFLDSDDPLAESKEDEFAGVDPDLLPTKFTLSSIAQMHMMEPQQHESSV